MRRRVVTAWSTLPDHPPYDGAAFRAGLAAAGCAVRPGWPARPDAGTVLLIWNRPRSKDAAAAAVEAAGGRVIVAENGYLGAGTRALALGHHAGRGRWPGPADGAGPERRVQLGLHPSPWRGAGEHVLVLGQRGIGHPCAAMPPGWDRRALQQLQRRTRRPLLFRPHPATSPGLRPLECDLGRCHAVVTWSSAAGLRALLLGWPVFAGLPGWIGAAACRPLGHDIEDPFLGDRRPMLERLAWAQWTLDEIAAGEPFRRLLAL